jgi:hypothetical protein
MRLFVLFLIVLLTGCTTATFQPTGACVDGESLILATVDQPAGLDKTLLMVNFAGLEKGKYTVQEVDDFLLDIEANLGKSYLDFANHLITKIDNVRRYVGVSMIFLGDDISTIGLTGGESAISACDQQLIKAHLANQRRLLELYK